MSNHQQEKLIDFVKNSILRDKKIGITADTLLFKEKILDSMNILDLMGYVEKQIGRRLSDEEIIMANFQSVKRINEVFFYE